MNHITGLTDRKKATRPHHSASSVPSAFFLLLLSKSPSQPLSCLPTPWKWQVLADLDHGRRALRCVTYTFFHARLPVCKYSTKASSTWRCSAGAPSLRPGLSASRDDWDWFKKSKRPECFSPFTRTMMGQPKLSPALAPVTGKKISWKDKRHHFLKNFACSLFISCLGDNTARYQYCSLTFSTWYYWFTAVFMEVCAWGVWWCVSMDPYQPIRSRFFVAVV